MTKDILIKYLNNNCSEAEQQEVLQWAKTEALTEEGKKLGLYDWNNYQEEDTLEDNKKFTTLFDRIQKEIDKRESLKQKHKALSLPLFTKWLTRVAAILLIPVLALSIWYYISSQSTNQTQEIAQSWVEINAPDGARVEFSLPDGSQGWLNSGSKLKYPAVFSENRKVELNGEAWFDIKHLDNLGFVVSVPEMDVKVLGTQFNVTAYLEDASTDVILEEGTVEINGTVGVFNQILSPNEKVSFNHKSRSIRLSEVNASRFSAWKDGYLIIDNESLGDVVGRIERWYNVDIDIQDEELNNYRFKATFKDEPLEEVLRLLAKTTPVIYKIEKRSVDSNGLLKQKKVTIKLKLKV